MFLFFLGFRDKGWLLHLFCYEAINHHVYVGKQLDYVDNAPPVVATYCFPCDIKLQLNRLYLLSFIFSFYIYYF